MHKCLCHELVVKQNIPAQQQRELEKKQQLEARFEPIAQRLLNAYIRRFFNAIFSEQDVPRGNVGVWQSAIFEHYQKTFRAFIGDVSAMVDEPRPQDEFLAGIVSEFENWADLESLQQAQFITATSQEYGLQSIALAQQQLFDQGLEIVPLSLARVARTLLRSRFGGRANNIAVTETQIGAERTKDTEGRAINRDVKPIVKEWVDIGDSRVRPAHRAASGQVVPADSQFIVGGFRMAYPTDSQFGAPLRLISRCRCTSRFIEQ